MEVNGTSWADYEYAQYVSQFCEMGLIRSLKLTDFCINIFLRPYLHNKPNTVIPSLISSCDSVSFFESAFFGLPQSISQYMVHIKNVPHWWNKRQLHIKRNELFVLGCALSNASFSSHINGCWCDSSCVIFHVCVSFPSRYQVSSPSSPPHLFKNIATMNTSHDVPLQ